MSEKQIRGLNEEALDNVSGGATQITNGYAFRNNEIAAMKNQLGNDSRYKIVGNNVYVSDRLSKSDKQRAMKDMETIIHDLGMKAGLDQIQY